MMGVLGWVGAIVAGLILGGLIGQYAVPGRQFPGGLAGALASGAIGGVLGALIPGNWGWTLDGANMVAAILVAAVLTWVVGFAGGKLAARNKSS
ncbi:MAG: GlsB/YeaQ/YmgE family stress response membrane protein [Bacillota bacterium]|nr:MAG: GlsB/YeaQ/YmgE family stress response membrane protein [Bacillota bacterium]